MTDLIERCENHGWHEDDAPLVWEMRDEIERLTAEVSQLKKAKKRLIQTSKKGIAREKRLRVAIDNEKVAQREIERLTAVLEYIAWPHYSDRKYELMAAAREALKDD